MLTNHRPVLFIAFLRQLENTNKAGFLLAMLILFLQLGFTFTKLEVTPFFLYGMYSEKIMPTDTFSVIRIFVNNKPLRSYAASFREISLLETTAEQYLLFRQNGSIDPVRTRIELKYPAITGSGLYQAFTKRIYNMPNAGDGFIRWCKERSLVAAHLASGTVSLVRTTYKIDRKRMYFYNASHEVLEQF